MNDIISEFTPTEASEKPVEEAAPVLKTWRACAERELTLLSTPPPRFSSHVKIYGMTFLGSYIYHFYIVGTFTFTLQLLNYNLK